MRSGSEERERERERETERGQDNNTWKFLISKVRLKKKKKKSKTLRGNHEKQFVSRSDLSETMTTCPHLIAVMRLTHRLRLTHSLITAIKWGHVASSVYKWDSMRWIKAVWRLHMCCCSLHPPHGGPFVGDVSVPTCNAHEQKLVAEGRGGCSCPLRL